MCDVNLTDITGTLGEWFDAGFDEEVPAEVRKLLADAYKIAAGNLDKRL
jgi:hypothetical protein